MASGLAHYFPGFRGFLIQLGLSFATATLYLAVTLPAQGSPVQLPGFNLKCDIPDDWPYAQEKGCLLRANSPYGTRGLFLNCKREPLSVTLDDPRYIQFLRDSSATETKGVVNGSGYVVMNNVRFFFVDAKAERDGTTTYFHQLFFLGDGLRYTFAIFKKDGNPVDDPELVSILQSCDFVQAPKPHTGVLTFWDIFHPVDLQEHSTTECFVYAVETCGRLLFIFLCPLLVYLGLTVFFYRMLFKKDRTPQQLAVPADLPSSTST
jgi:hypothetical protein